MKLARLITGNMFKKAVYITGTIQLILLLLGSLANSYGASIKIDDITRCVYLVFPLSLLIAKLITNTKEGENEN